MKIALNIEGLTISQIGKKCFRLSQVAYAKACIEASDAIHDVRNTWIGTSKGINYLIIIPYNETHTFLIIHKKALMFENIKS